MQVYSTYRYTFDRVYGPDSNQQEVYEHSAKDAVQQVLEVPPPSPPPPRHPALHPGWPFDTANERVYND